MANDPFDLQRFMDAQVSVYAEVLEELRNGHKQSHWMWFIFPQITGLGFSSMAARYAISGLPEAVAYLNHPVLGQRLRECTVLVNRVERSPILQILGSPDDLKFRSSMTLFAQATANSAVFTEALDKYFGGKQDSRTIQLLQRD